MALDVFFLPMAARNEIWATAAAHCELARVPQKIQDGAVVSVERVD